MTTSVWVRAGAPLLMLTYGVLRLIDGSDGHRDKDGPLWIIGHVCFFAALLLLGALSVGLRRLTAHRWPTLTSVAVVGALFGTGCFLWVVTGDIFPSFPNLPDPLQALGPALFQLGLLTLLVLPAIDRRLPAWCPIVVLVAFAAIAIDLNLIPPAALLLLAGLHPLRRV